MANIYLKRLSVQSFQSFANLTVFEFDKNGLILVRGINHDTGGSSGAGKSSLNLALAYALGYNHVPATELKSWLNDEPVQVILELEKDGQDIVISRGAKTFIIINNNKITSAAAVDKAIVDLFKIPQELLAALTYRPQREFGLFLNKTDSEKKEFLTQILGLNSFEEQVETVNKNIKNLELQEQKACNLAFNLKQQLQDLQNEVLPIEEDTKLHETIIESLEIELKSLDLSKANQNLQLARQSLQIIENNLQNQKNQEIQLLKQSITYDPSNHRSAEIIKIQEYLSILKNIISTRTKIDQDNKLNIHTQKARLEHIIFQIKEKLKTIPDLQKELEILNQSICPTCTQQWTNNQTRKDEIIGLLDTLEDYKPILEQNQKQLESLIYVPDEVLSTALEAQQKMSDELLILQKEIQGLEITNKNIFLNKIDSIETKYKELIKYETLQQKIIISEYEQAVAQLTNKINNLNTRLAVQKAELKSTINNNIIIKNITKQHLDKVNDLSERSKTALEAHELCRKEYNAELDYAGLIGREGFLGAIFEEVLVEIATEANAMLARVPNVSHVTIKFDIQSQTQKGTIKKSITPIITINGMPRSLNGLSGGMRSAVELIVDLAVGNVIARRSGVTPGWLILDESFDGLDFISKEACMGVLQRVASDRLMIVVDHAEEFKELFSRSINIQHRQGVSFV